jgi:hypothetical protein|tara:strand:+ start:10164 stop:10916 length:753 start_codon:yes stop_codon:yes gene_type:complete
MGIDLKKMRAKLTTLQSKGERKSDLFWRPSDGEQTIRIVPTADGDPFKEFWFHYDVGGNPGFLSPKRNFGEDDPLDSFVRQLWKEGSEDSVKMAKKLSARQRFFSPVIVRGEEDKGVRIWGYGKMAYQELLNLVLNPDYGDITDTIEGTDLVLTYGKPPGAQFPQTNLTPRRKASKLLGTDEKISQALDSIPEFSSLFERKTAEQVQTMLDEFLLGEDDAEEVSVEAKKYSKKSTSGDNAVDKAFAELLT